MHPGLTKRLYAGALVLDAERQPAKNVVELTRYFGFAVAPASRAGGQRLGLRSHFHVRRIDHQGHLVSALLSQFLSHLLIEHAGKESVLKIASVESDTTYCNLVLCVLARDEQGAS